MTPPRTAAPERPPELLPPDLGVSPALAAVLGWLVPGLGQVAVGRIGAGLVLLAAIGGLFVTGLALTDFTAVEPREHQLEFVAQALIAGPTSLALGLTEGVRLERMPPWLDVGRLFVVISGLLNLIALCDALGEAARRNALARAEHQRLRAALLPEPPTPAPPPILPPPAPESAPEPATTPSEPSDEPAMTAGPSASEDAAPSTPASDDVPPAPPGAPTPVPPTPVLPTPLLPTPLPPTHVPPTREEPPATAAPAAP